MAVYENVKLNKEDIISNLSKGYRVITSPEIDGYKVYAHDNGGYFKYNKWIIIYQVGMEKEDIKIDRLEFMDIDKCAEYLITISKIWDIICFAKGA